MRDVILTVVLIGATLGSATSAAAQESVVVIEQIGPTTSAHLWLSINEIDASRSQGNPVVAEIEGSRLLAVVRQTSLRAQSFVVQSGAFNHAHVSQMQSAGPYSSIVQTGYGNFANVLQ